MYKCKEIQVIAVLNDVDKAKAVIEEVRLYGSGLVSLPEFRGVQACIDEVTQAIIEHEQVHVVTMFPQAVNYLGELVYEKIIPQDKASVLLYRDNEITLHYFDNDGCLTDWPYGCMEPESSGAVHILKHGSDGMVPDIG